MKRIASLLLSFTFFCLFGLAQRLNGGNISSVTTEKQWYINHFFFDTPLLNSEKTKTIKYYLDKDLDGDGLFDLGYTWHLKNNLLYSGDLNNTYRLALIIPGGLAPYSGSKVNFFIPDTNIAKIYYEGNNYSIFKYPSVYRFSKTAPLNTCVRASTSLPILFEIPTSRKSSDAIFQVQYETSIATFRSFDPNYFSEYQLFTVKSMDDHQSITNENSWYLENSLENEGLGPKWDVDFNRTATPIKTNKINWGDEFFNSSIIFEYKFSWCGDGILNSSDSFSNGAFSEECDPNDPEKKNWGTNGCDCNCKKDNSVIIDSISKPKIWLVCVGVSDYSDELNLNGINDLTYCDVDAEKVCGFYKSPQGGAVPSNQISLLLNSNATKENILNECNRLYNLSKKNDLVVFYFSGHGGEDLFCTYNGLINHQDLRNIIYNCKAEKKICIADACRAGSWNKGNINIKKSLSDDESMRLYYDALANTSNGIALLMASKTNENSTDDSELKQGLFTYYFIEGLKGSADSNFDRIITLIELYDFVKQKVSTRSLTRWGKSQTPVLNGTFDANMPIGIRSN